MSINHRQYRLSALWRRAMNFTPTQPQLERMALWFEMAVTLWRAAMVAALVFEVGEVLVAFLPGGPGYRLLGGK